MPRFSTVRLGATAWRLGVLGDGDDRLVIGLDCADLQSRTRSDAERVPHGAAPRVAGHRRAAVGGSPGRALRPLRSIRQVAEGMTARGLDQRIALSEEDPEIARLIRC